MHARGEAHFSHRLRLYDTTASYKRICLNIRGPAHDLTGPHECPDARCAAICRCLSL